MKLTYKGRHTNGVYVVTDGGEVFIAHDGSADVPDAVANKLLAEQPDAFSQVRKTKSAKADVAEEAE